MAKIWQLFWGFEVKSFRSRVRLLRGVTHREVTHYSFQFIGQRVRDPFYIFINTIRNNKTVKKTNEDSEI